MNEERYCWVCGVVVAHFEKRSDGIEHLVVHENWALHEKKYVCREHAEVVKVIGKQRYNWELEVGHVIRHKGVLMKVVETNTHKLPLAAAEVTVKLQRLLPPWLEIEVKLPAERRHKVFWQGSAK